MRVGFVLSVLAVVAVIHCGGKVEGSNPCPTASAGSSCSEEGAECTVAIAVCNRTGSENCTCTHGSWFCPEVMPVCPDQCPGTTFRGEACADKGLACPAVVPMCGSQESVTCTCNGATFDCPVHDCPASCPKPSDVIQGASCTSPPQEICPSSSDPDGCACIQNAWACELAVDGGLPDAGAKD